MRVRPIYCVIYVVRVPNRGSPPAILLRELPRGRKVNPHPPTCLLARGQGRGPFPGAEGQPPPAGLAGRSNDPSLPHGHVAAVLGTARQLALEDLITRRRPGAGTW